MRIKIIKPHKKYKVGDTVQVTPNVGFGLIDSGVAVITKDIVASDYRIKRGNSK